MYLLFFLSVLVVAIIKVSIQHVRFEKILAAFATVVCDCVLCQ